MSALSIQPTYPIFTDIDGQPLEDGYVWIGVASLSPIGNPITVYWDAALTIPAVQPIRTRGGYPVNSGTPARLYVNSDYSIQVQNKNGSVVYSAATATERYSDVVVSGISSDKVTFLQTGAGAVESTAERKMRDFVSVYDFMTAAEIAASKAGSPLNNTAAFTAALAAHKSVYIPAGTYKITNEIVLQEAATLFGSGRTTTIIRCDTNLHTGVFLSVGGRSTIKDFSMYATGPKAGTGIRFESPDGEYQFTGHTAAYNILSYRFAIGFDVNNYFDLLLERCEAYENVLGVRVMPSYSPSTDSGYYTTLTFFKCYFAFSDNEGFKAISTINGQVMHFLDSVIERNGGTNGQIDITRCFFVKFTSCYTESQPASPRPWLFLSDVGWCEIENQWQTGTGGVDIGEYTGQLTVINSAIGNLKGASTGALGQNIYVVGSAISNTTVADTVTQRYISTSVNGNYEKDLCIANQLKMVGDPSNTSSLNEFRMYSTTVSATINAGATAALVVGEYSANLFNAYVVGHAQLTGPGNPGLILSVTPETTGPNFDQYFNVYATNTTGAPITLTSVTLNVVFFIGYPIIF